MIISFRFYIEGIKVWLGFKKAMVPGYRYWVVEPGPEPPRLHQEFWKEPVELSTVATWKAVTLTDPLWSILMRNTAPSFWLIHELLQPYLRAWEMAQPLAAQAWGLEFVSTAAMWMMAVGYPACNPRLARRRSVEHAGYRQMNWGVPGLWETLLCLNIYYKGWTTYLPLLTCTHMHLNTLHLCHTCVTTHRLIPQTYVQ